MRSFIITIIFLFLVPSVCAGGTAFEDTVAGKRCNQNTQTISCRYKVGKDLEFTIDGIGDPDTGISFLHSNFDGDYFATFGLRHGCVIVKHGRDPRLPPDFAFVSPRNGKVYKTWEDCKAGY
jgi:hypothetical protein